MDKVLYALATIAMIIAIAYVGFVPTKVPNATWLFWH